MLGDAIPAESFAAGANETGGVENNYNMQIDTPNGWPREDFEWLHSDIKNMAYYYIYPAFDKILQKGNLK
jgi:hypothetical protein